ncbi:MAG: hypothetical protein ABIQ44_16365 [Chloroflexia bacterium]
MRSSKNLVLGLIVVVVVVSVFFLLPKSNDADTIKHAMEVSRQLSGYHFVSQGANTKEGDWSAPGNLRMDVAAKKGTVTLIVIGKDPYIRVPVSDTFAHLVNALSNSDPLSITGGALLSTFGSDSKDVHDVLNVGDDMIGGVAVVHFKYSYTYTSPQFPSGADIDQEVWIQKSTGYVYQLRTMGGSPIVETYSRINEPVTPPIEAPAKFTEVSSDSIDFTLMIADAFTP